MESANAAAGYIGGRRVVFGVFLHGGRQGTLWVRPRVFYYGVDGYGFCGGYNGLLVPLQNIAHSGHSDSRWFSQLIQL